LPVTTQWAGKREWAIVVQQRTSRSGEFPANYARCFSQLRAHRNAVVPCKRSTTASQLAELHHSQLDAQITDTRSWFGSS